MRRHLARVDPVLVGVRVVSRRGLAGLQHQVDSREYSVQPGA